MLSNPAHNRQFSNDHSAELLFYTAGFQLSLVSNSFNLFMQLQVIQKDRKNGHFTSEKSVKYLCSSLTKSTGKWCENFRENVHKLLWGLWQRVNCKKCGVFREWCITGLEFELLLQCVIQKIWLINVRFCQQCFKSLFDEKHVFLSFCHVWGAFFLWKRINVI